jgi:5-methylcytosine-specific restriction endonuclease McrA
MRKSYSVPRKLLNFRTNEELILLKELSGTIRDDGTIGEIDLWKKVEILLPAVSLQVLGREIDFSELRKRTFEEQGLKITPHKLYLRAWNRSNNNEYSSLREVVEKSYYSIVHGIELKDEKRSEKRNFSDDQLSRAMERQENKCYYCNRPFNETYRPVADHFIPYSRNGNTSDENCIASCVDCNREKGDMSPFHFGIYVERKNSRGRKGVVK